MTATNTEPMRKTEVSAAEAGRRLGVDKATTSRWLHSGKMHGTRTAGGHWRVPVSEVERLEGEAAAVGAPAIAGALRQAQVHLAAAHDAAEDRELRRLIRRAEIAARRALAYAGGGG